MHEVGVCGHDAYSYRANLEGPGGEYRLFEVPICQCAMHGSKRAHPALLVSLCTKWAYAVTMNVATVRILEAPGGEYRLVEVPICECAMQGRKRPHPDLLVSSCTKWAYAVTMELATVRILEALGVNIAYSRSQFAYCAMQGSKRPHPALLVYSCTRWAYAVTMHIATVRTLKAPGGEYRIFEVPICQCAMHGSKRPHPALLVSSCTKRAYAVTMDVATVRTSEGPV